MTQPKGFEDNTHLNHVCHLRKALYGLKQAPRQWYNTFANTVITLGFTQSQSDPSLFIYKKDQVCIFLLVYVDDILISGNNLDRIQHVLDELNNKFNMKHLGEVSEFLGIKITKQDNSYFLCQENYVQQILAQANLTECKELANPTCTKIPYTFNCETNLQVPTMYRQITGSLQYLTITRPDISYSVNLLSQHMHEPQPQHVYLLKRLLRYLKGTSKYGLPVTKSDLQLQSFSDADWAGDPESRKSTSGYCSFLGNTLISWTVKKQHTIARSSTESEYRALAALTADVLWIHRLLFEFGITQSTPTNIYCDNTSAIALANNPASETLILPQDEKWPFLLRFTISSFGVSVGIGIQAFLWKIIATSPSMSFLHVSSVIYYVLWCIAVSLMILVASTYVLKMIFYFEAVKREFLHPIRVNFFFTPWIGCILLVVSAPPSIAKHLHSALWYVLMAPILFLELNIYGQWMMGGERRLSKVANPSTHLSIAGNFAVALLGSSMGLKEGPVFFFAVGLAHYLVLFVTLYQRLPTNEALPKDLHPVFFLFVAVPSLASVSWSRIVGHFDLGSRIAYFTSMFIYASLVVRVNFFRGFRFSLAWWAYTVPMASASIATIIYAGEVDSLFMKILSVALSFISTLTCLALVISTIFHAFVLHNLFPNDIAIAITLKKSS
ncbi:S-type anion channel SLAH2-like [Dendrobium catenatum]|uniref:S-type anion channel SLAH2-like n=1 Tax=Dendrobium catenatum TaxID=906689 RepID=UPI0009F5F7F0|nr:S-type anion channel SLAH2-like [Dendrobium catenatum]